MKAVLQKLTLLAVLLSLSPLAQAAPLGWQPQHTWVFVVGLVQFKDTEMFGSFPTKDRRDERLVQFFRGRGVPPSHIVYLQDRQATVSAINTDFVALLRQTAPGDTLILYYEGHGYLSEDAAVHDAYFAAYDTNDDVAGWSINSITAMIDRYFKGRRVLLTADCCYSGYLASTVKKDHGPISYACVTSSSAREESTGHWTFSDCLLDALRGAPYVDMNHDGVITVGELAAFAHDEMAIAEEQHASFALSGNFDRETVLATAGPQPPSPIGQRVKAKQDGEWYAGRVVAAKGGQLEVRYIGYDEPAEWFDPKDTTQLQWIKPRPTFPIGAAVEVEWQGKWYPATVLKVDGGVHFIHYTDYDASWDEWVSSKRIRKPRE